MATAATATAATKELRESLQVKAPGEMVDWINALFYGDPGAGKTYLCGTADDDPRLSPVLIADVEGGVTTLRHRKSVDVVPIRSMSDIEQLYNKLYLSIKDGKIYYKTVCIDSLTELADLDMRSIMKDAFKRSPDKVDIDVPSPREWGKTRNHIRTIVRAFRDLPCHVIYTCHVASLQENEQPTKYYPGFAGKLKGEVPGFMDIVGYMTAKAQEGVTTRSIQFLGTNRVVAKDRTSSLGDSLVDPNLSMMWDLISAK